MIHVKYVDIMFCRGEALQRLNEASHILITIPPRPKLRKRTMEAQQKIPSEFVQTTTTDAYSGLEDIDPVLYAHASDIIDNRRLKWISYISSTSVYGNHESGWVNEESPLLETDCKGMLRQQAEKEWMTIWKIFDIPLHIFRCGGIYGPTRSMLWNLRTRDISQNPVLPQRLRRQMQRYISRCHILDLCRVLEVSSLKPTPGEIFNIVDEEPSSRQEVEIFCQNLLHQSNKNVSASTSPTQEESLHKILSRMTETQESFKMEQERNKKRDESISPNYMAHLKGEKRVSNRKVKKYLDFDFVFPTYREGVMALHEDDIRPFRL